MDVLAQKRMRCVHKELSQMRAPEVCLVSSSEEADPESQIQLGDQARRVERLTFVLQRILSTQNLGLLRMLQTHSSVVVPARAERICESFVNLVSQCDFKPLDGTVKRFAEGCVPHVKTKRLRGVAGGNIFVTLQSFA